MDDQPPPRFKHDCEYCTWLGQYEEFDLYYCPQIGLPTVIARYGTRSRYLSGMSQAVNLPGSPLGEARKRAIAKGLI